MSSGSLRPFYYSFCIFIAARALCVPNGRATLIISAPAVYNRHTPRVGAQNQYATRAARLGVQERSLSRTITHK